MEEEKEELFPDVPQEAVTFKPNIIAQGSVSTVHVGAMYGVVLPQIFPSKLEEEYIASDLIRSLEETGLNMLEIYIGFKQLESIAQRAQDESKAAATETARNLSVKVCRGVKVSMRAFNSFWKYNDEVQAQIDVLAEEKRKIEDRIKAIQQQAQIKGDAEKMKPSGHSLSIKFREV
jgi:hypothetical protein